LDSTDRNFTIPCLFPSPECCMRLLSLVKNIRNWPEYLYFKLFKHPDSSFTFRCTQGIHLTVPGRLLHTFKESFLGEGYLRGFPKDFFSKAPLVVDIGANAGYFSFYILSRFPQARILAFEPVEKNFRQLRQYQDVHSQFVIKAFHEAVGERTGTMTLYLDQSDSFSTSASMHQNSFGSDPVTVPSICLEDIFIREKIDTIDLLKLDCEGAEYGILFGLPEMLFSRIRAITLETHQGSGEGEDKFSLAKYLGNLGYQVKLGPCDLMRAWKAI
jgi:FkbM family methyltransferase